MRRMPADAFTTADHVELLGAEADRFAASLTGADLDATVVTCPDWTVRDLVSHVGGLHRWSTELVASCIVAET
jgi:3-dehydroquinate synthase class II